MRSKTLIPAVLTAAAIALATSAAYAVDPNPLDPSYTPPPYSEIHKGDGMMTKDEYMKYSERTWDSMNVKAIDKNYPQYPTYQKSPRFGLIDEDSDGVITRDEYVGFHGDVWGKMKRSDPNSISREEFEQSVQDSNNPLNPSFKHN